MACGQMHLESCDPHEFWESDKIKVKVYFSHKAAETCFSTSQGYRQTEIIITELWRYCTTHHCSLCRLRTMGFLMCSSVFDELYHRALTSTSSGGHALMSHGKSDLHFSRINAVWELIKCDFCSLWSTGCILTDSSVLHTQMRESETQGSFSRLVSLFIIMQ